MSELTIVREVARKSRQVLAAEANVSHTRLWKAEHGFIELTPAEQAAIDRALVPALASSFRVVADYQRSRQVAS